MKSKAYILKCIELVEEKMNWGSNKDWIDYNFRSLSEQIFKVSKVSISVRTLKRIFRQDTDSEVFYEPQIATKNALAVFLGYTDWAAFVLTHFPRAKDHPQEEHELQENPEPEEALQDSRQSVHETKSKIQGRHLIWLAPAILILLTLFGIYFWKPEKVNIEFTAKNIIADNYAFKYDISSISYNTATVDLDYTVYKTLTTKKGEFTYPFKLPDYYKVKLIVDGEIRTRKDIHIPSNEWVCVLQQNQKERLMSNKVLYNREGILHFANSELARIKIDTADEFWLDFRNFKDFDIDGDNLILEIDVKNDQKSGGIDCFDTSVEYIGESGTGRVKLVRPGCANFAVFEFGEVRFNGNFHDLSPFGADLSKWNKVKIEVVNKKVNVFLNNKLSYKNSYKQAIGNVKGFKIKFKGSGSMDNIRVFNTKKQLIYREDFNGLPVEQR
ncbi:hypothetical protein [Desertivirga xinjiangensis]|uniref:hypothetical protein n=1 Tax=Desertivirga xinjiangensis TaxID=539206 RepID=UPI0021093622|nr:hypothetical protein [Pedobacter xinjiangensis]